MNKIQKHIESHMKEVLKENDCNISSVSYQTMKIKSSKKVKHESDRVNQTMIAKSQQKKLLGKSPLRGNKKKESAQKNFCNLRNRSNSKGMTSTAGGTLEKSNQKYKTAKDEGQTS